MIVCLDVPDEAAGELKQALDLVATYADGRRTIAAHRGNSEEAGHWALVATEARHAEQSILVRPDILGELDPPAVPPSQ